MYVYEYGCVVTDETPKTRKTCKEKILKIFAKGCFLRALSNPNETPWLLAM